MARRCVGGRNASKLLKRSRVRFAASLASNRFAPEGKSLAEFGTSNANSEEAKVEEPNSDPPWLSSELLERVFG